MRCFECKEIGYFQRTCPLSNSQSTEGPIVKIVGRFCDKTSHRKRNHDNMQPIVEVGMNLPVRIYGIRKDMLIDSGATASLLSPEVYYSLPAETR